METKRTINAFERALLFFSRFFTAVSDVFDISEQIENNFMSYMLIDWKSLFTETSSQVANSRILHIAPVHLCVFADRCDICMTSSLLFLPW